MANFKRNRQALHLSQNGLSRKADVSRWKVWASEQGDYELTPDEADRIRQALRREAARLRTISQNIDVADEISA
jgi:predicted transcriptional regulator